jgi:hypothetical protein
MIEEIDGMPGGTIGFRASGAVDVEEYKRVLMPPLERAVDEGHVRLLFEAGPDFEKFDPATLWADTKNSVNLGVRHHDAWERTAMVTDVDWIARASQLFAWAVPGELRVFRLDRLEDAKAWLAEGLPTV